MAAQSKFKMPKNMDEIPWMLDVYYAAFIYGVTTATIWNWHKKKGFPIVTIEGSSRIRKDQLIEWMNSLEGVGGEKDG